MNDTLEIIFPSKPKEDTIKNSFRKTILSLIFFVGFFHYVLRWEFYEIIILSLVLMFHELGHFFAMKHFKYKDLGIYFVPMIGAFASGEKEKISQKQTLIVLLAGPIPGLLIGILLYILYYPFFSDDYYYRAFNSLVFLNLFNLLPIMPLDGGRVIKNLFIKNSFTLNIIFLILSMIALSYFFILYENFVLLIIPFLMLGYISNSFKIKNMRKSLSESGINLDQSFNKLSDKEYWLIRDEIPSHFEHFSKFVIPGKYEISKHESKIISQVKLILNENQIQDLSFKDKLFFTLIYLTAFVLPIYLIFKDSLF